MGGPPDGGEDLALGDDAPGMAHQHRQQVEFLRRQFENLAVLDDAPALQIDQQSFGLVARRAGAVGGGMAQSGAQAGQKVADGEGLFDIIVGAEVERDDLFRLAVARGKHDYRAVAEFSRLPQHILAVHVRQAEVEHDDVGRAVAIRRNASAPSCFLGTPLKAHPEDRFFKDSIDRR